MNEQTDIKLNDHLNNNDKVSFGMQKTPYARTRIIGGYDAYTDERGVTRFGTKVFETSNMIVLGGSLFTLEKVFGVTSPLNVEYLNDIMSIANTGTAVTEIYPKENVVCLFGVGTGGAGETITDVLDVKYYEREIIDMIPLRQTANALTADESAKYWFKKPVTVNGVEKTQYYLKRFETSPTIHVLWRDAEGEDEDGSEVSSNVHNTPSSNTTPIDTFIELTFKISKKDIREYFEDMGDIEVARINSIGLFTGVLGTTSADGVTPVTQDYKQVKLFSKLNINNEIMTLSKDLTIVYRIYTS